MHSVAYISTIAAMIAAIKAESGSGEPGYCEDDKSCEDNYVCISVQTTRSGIEDVKQCLPYAAEGDVCSGTFSGLCPSFSTWNTAFQSISSVCAYQLPSGTDQCLNNTFSGSDTDGFVSCVNIREGSGSSAENVGVIYGCVDFDGTNLLFDEDSDNWELSSQMNYTAVINAGCVNPKNGENSDVVCSGRGTCAPGSSGGMDYECQCNIGYNGTYCQKIVSNKCTLESQCQAGTCNLATQECECEEGTTGDQCAYCDPESPKACNGQGTCVPAVTSTDASLAGNNITTAGDLDSAGDVDSAGGLNSGNAVNVVDNTGSAEATDSVSAVTNMDSDQSTRFLMEMVGMASSSDSGSGNVCKCNSGYTGDQCTRKVESSSSGDDSKKRGNSPSSDAISVATSVALVVSVVMVAFLN
ncbi:unnamed protein product [Peronospora belbahrii]|uniref:EGF-like domain-containing protein n=1 Tax=Peronospora belbahrii TaxID=622444 RepID=A0AAU9L1U5_9STRA|nr:unnamed protein product [Peronospora belbahrii]CAH0520505.1 unnamed protein product [Peronospora belbahrii]